MLMFTSAQHGLPLKLFVFNNGGLGLVHLEMEEAALPVFTKGAGFKNPDFALFAQACGPRGRGFRVTQPHALRETVAQALAAPVRVIVDVVDPTGIPSMPHVELLQGVEIRYWQNARGIHSLVVAGPVQVD